MERICANSRIEIWDTLYINNTNLRQEKDKNVVIVQIEPGSGEGSYIVEIMDR